MWVPAVIGMAIYTSNKTGISLGQIQILFAPFFTAYGTAFVLNLIARHSNKELISILRGGVLLLSLLITSLPLLLNLPHIVRVGILTAGRGIPAWPPYYPLGLNRDLRTQTAEKDFILTDQPSAVGWYADRKAIGIPKMVEQFMVLERILKFHGGTSAPFPPPMENSLPSFWKARFCSRPRIKTPCTSLTTAGRLPPWRSALERLTPANSFRERK